MKGIFNERNLAATLFVMVLVTFTLAQKETKKLEQFYNGGKTALGKSVDQLLKTRNTPSVSVDYPQQVSSQN